MIFSYYCLIRIRCFFVFFFKQKSAYELRISDWSSDVCSSVLDATCVIVERRRRLPAQFLDVAPQFFAPKMLPCRDAAAHRADPRRNTLAHGKMDARCERAVEIGRAHV